MLGTDGSTLEVASYTVNDTNSGGNYTVTSSGTAIGTITKRDLTIAAVTDAKVYDGTTASTVEPSVIGLQFGDTVSPLTQMFQSKNVLGTNGSTLEVASFTVNDTNSGGNYDVTSNGTALGTITKASLTISASTDSKTYDGTTTSGQTPSVTGLQIGDTVSSLTQAFQSKNVLGTDGSTLEVASYTVNDTNSGGNYTVTSSGTAVGTIAKRDLTIAAVTDTKVYDGTTSSGQTPTLSGLQTGDTVTPVAGRYSNRRMCLARTGARSRSRRIPSTIRIRAATTT